MNWLRRVMAGRYGIDPLGYALIAASLVCMVLRAPFHRGFTGFLLSLASLGLLAYCYLRVFSRNYEKRRLENERFLSWWRPAFQWLLGRKGAFEEWQAYKHFQCPHCSQKCRVPRGRGKISVTCPGCHQQFVKKT